MNESPQDRINKLFPMNIPFEREFRIAGIKVDIEELKRQPVCARSIEDEYLIKHFRRSPKSLDRSEYKPVQSNLEYQDPKSVYEDITKALDKHMEAYDKYHQQKYFLYMHRVDYHKLVLLLGNTYMARCIYNPQPDNLDGFGLLHGNRRASREGVLFDIYSESELEFAVQFFSRRDAYGNILRTIRNAPDYLPLSDCMDIAKRENRPFAPIQSEQIKIPIEVAIAYLIYTDKQKSQ